MTPAVFIQLTELFLVWDFFKKNSDSLRNQQSARAGGLIVVGDLNHVVETEYMKPSLMGLAT